MSGAVIEPRTPSTPRTSAEYRSAGWRIVRHFTMQSHCSEAPPSRFVRTKDDRSLWIGKESQRKTLTRHYIRAAADKY